MSKPTKALVTNELRDRYAGLESACVVELTGMNVQQQEKLRRMLRKKSARLEVVKNSLIRRALEGGPLEPLGRALDGPCALVTSRESLVEVAKSLLEAAKEFKKLKLKQAIVDGDPSLVSIESVSRRKTRAQLLGEVAMLISSPGRALAGCLRGPQARIAGCLKALAALADNAG
jgi:large subunit ribosomal protein L10